MFLKTIQAEKLVWLTHWNHWNKKLKLARSWAKHFRYRFAFETKREGFELSQCNNEGDDNTEFKIQYNNEGDDKAGLVATSHTGTGMLVSRLYKTEKTGMVNPLKENVEV